MTAGIEVMREGGKWLASTRTYLQWHAHRGESLTWGSEEEVRGLTVRDIEQLAADAVAADRNEQSRNNPDIPGF